MPQVASNIRMQDSQMFDEATGKPIVTRTVTFAVGSHGPFRITGTQADLPTAVIKQKIQEQVDQVNEIESMQDSAS